LSRPRDQVVDILKSARLEIPHRSLVASHLGECSLLDALARLEDEVLEVEET
jgi:hypothetical protein